MELSIILSIVLFHELGHYTMARIFNWRVQSIMLWVFGGVMTTEEHGNKSILEEALVTIAGPFQHVFVYIGLFFLSTGSLLTPSLLELIFYYNTVILLFNLLPIWPLDGGKLLFICLSALLPYRKAYHFIIMFSMITSIVLVISSLFFIPFTLSIFLIMAFLFMENRTEWKQRYYVFMRFLLRLYEGNGPVNGVQSILVSHQQSLMDVFYQFRREKKHSIYITFPDKARKSIDESDCLRSFFYEKQYNQMIGQVVNKL